MKRMMNKEYIRRLPVGLTKKGQTEILPTDTGIKPFNQGNTSIKPFNQGNTSNLPKQQTAPKMITNKEGVKLHDVNSFNIPRYKRIAGERNKDILNNSKDPGLLDRLKAYSDQAWEWANKQNPWHLGLGAAGVVGGGLLLSDLLRRRRRRRDD